MVETGARPTTAAPWITAALLVGFGCSVPSQSDGGGSEGATGSPTTATTTASAATSTGRATVTSTGDSTSTDAAGSSSTGQPEPPWDPGPPPIPTPSPCDNKTYACGDQEDNDGDGRIDGFDPDCTGPCDDDESSLATGLPLPAGCEHECFFDDNNNSPDECIWDLRCDPLGPGATIGCDYAGGAGCPSVPAPQSRGCTEECEPSTPRGCDCFGCCVVPGGSDDQGVFIGSPGCELDNLGACQPCTPQIEACGRECKPAQCHICFGATTPPPGCPWHECPLSWGGCGDHDDCGGGYCFDNCCLVPKP